VVGVRKTFAITTVAALAVLCALAAMAQAKPLPSNSAVDQYVEAIPSAGGNEPSPTAVAASPVTPNTPDARAAKLAKVTAPASSPPSGESGTSGMGILLPLIIAAALLGAIALFVARRRHAAGSA
jgi:hypothetical protein